jgi:hypothetical protein
VIPGFRLDAVPVLVQWMLPPGTVLITPNAILCRHVSEFLLLLAGARWHPHGGRCPTWTEAAECRCMVEES